MGDNVVAEAIGYSVKFLVKELEHAYKEGNPTELWISTYNWDSGEFMMVSQNGMKLPRRESNKE